MRVIRNLYLPEKNGSKKEQEGLAVASIERYVYITSRAKNREYELNVSLN